MKSRIASVLSLLTVVAACTPQAAPPPPAPDANAIRAAINTELQKIGPMLQSKDVSKIGALFTDDATWILPDATTFKGRAEIEAGAKAFVGSYESATPGELVIDRLIVVSDNEAVTFSHGLMEMGMKGKKPEHHNNPFADHWKKGADGVWRIAYEVNADGVVPPMPAK